MPKLEDARMTSTADREIVATRLFHAPRALVFRMWTDREHISNWWGPRGFTTTTYEMDLRPGGVWRFVMHGPDGRDYHSKIVYIELAKPERLVYKHVSEPGMEPVNCTVTVTFEDEGGDTRLTSRMIFPTASERDHVAKTYSAIEGLHQTLARLDGEIARMAALGSTGQEFVISRELAAPCELVFKAWTEAERISQWWGPMGSGIRVAQMDARPGGVFHYSMTTPTGEEWWGKFVYREIVSPERIVYVNSFSDAEGGITRHPLQPMWPLELHSTVIFTEHDGRTTLTLRWVPLNGSEEECKIFEGMHESMQEGWGGTLEQLADYLEKA